MPVKLAHSLKYFCGFTTTAPRKVLFEIATFIFDLALGSIWSGFRSFAFETGEGICVGPGIWLWPGLLCLWADVFPISRRP